MSTVAVKPDVSDRAAWTYVSGLASALEGRLLTHRATVDMLATESLDDLLARVRQTLLFDNLADTASPFELANSMDACYAANLRYIRRYSPTPALAEVFLLVFDWQAFRGYLRSQAVGASQVETPGSDVPVDVWEQCWRSAQVGPPNEHYAAAAASIREKMPREAHDERLVDEITEAHKSRHITHCVARLGSPSAAEWITTWTKLRLALELLRCSINGWPHIRIADALNDFGVSNQDIMAFATPERADWRSPMARLGLPAVESIDDDEPRPTVVLDRLIDDRMTDLVRDGGGWPFGPEPVTAFLWGMRTEWINLKLMVTGVAAGLPRDVVAQEFRQTHV